MICAPRNRLSHQYALWLLFITAGPLFRFSTTNQLWEQLNAQQVSGSPPSARTFHGMVAVGIDLYVFGGIITVISTNPSYTLPSPSLTNTPPSSGENGLCATGHLLDEYLIER
jgi:hypothetical protein